MPVGTIIGTNSTNVKCAKSTIFVKFHYSKSTLLYNKFAIDIESRVYFIIARI